MNLSSLNLTMYRLSSDSPSESLYPSIILGHHIWVVVTSTEQRKQNDYIRRVTWKNSRSMICKRLRTNGFQDNVPLWIDVSTQMFPVLAVWGISFIFGGSLFVLSYWIRPTEPSYSRGRNLPSNNPYDRNKPYRYYLLSEHSLCTPCMAINSTEYSVGTEWLFLPLFF